MDEVKEEGRNEDEDHDIELANRTTNMTKRKKLWIIYWKRKRLFENACYRYDDDRGREGRGSRGGRGGGDWRMSRRRRRRKTKDGGDSEKEWSVSSQA